MFRKFFNSTLKLSSTKSTFDCKWLSRPELTQRILLSGEHQDLIRLQERLAKHGIPSVFWPQEGKISRLEIWDNSSLFLKRIDEIIEKAQKDEQPPSAGITPSL